MSYGSTDFINCDKKDLETCCEKLLTQPQSFQTETLAILLCYLPYLFSALMPQTGFFLFVSDSWKIHPTTHSYKLDPCSCGCPKRDSESSCPSSFSNADFNPEELRSNMKDTVKFLSRQISLFLGLPSPLFPNNFCGLFFFAPRDRNLHSGTLEIFSLYYQRSLHLPVDISSAGPSCAEWRAHPPLLALSCLSLLFDGGRHADQVASWANLLPVKIWDGLAKT